MPLKEQMYSVHISIHVQLQETDVPTLMKDAVKFSEVLRSRSWASSHLNGTSASNTVKMRWGFFCHALKALLSVSENYGENRLLTMLRAHPYV